MASGNPLTERKPALRFAGHGTRGESRAVPQFTCPFRVSGFPESWDATLEAQVRTPG